MDDVTTVVDRYLAAWNETDAAKRRALLAGVLSDDVTFCDPLAEITGVDAVDQLIAGMQAQLPGGVLERAGEIEAHHQIARFRWDAGPEGDRPMIKGTDIAIFGSDGRIRAINGFFDHVEAGLLG